MTFFEVLENCSRSGFCKIAISRPPYFRLCSDIYHFDRNCPRKNLRKFHLCSSNRLGATSVFPRGGPQPPPPPVCLHSLEISWYFFNHLTLFPRCKKRQKFFVGHFSKKKNVIRNAHNLVNEIGHSYHIFIISNNDRQYIF